jgi:site-specific DNA-methyltransferase (adenine-specific)/adenine-specific DNA-methyltransferase
MKNDQPAQVALQLTTPDTGVASVEKYEFEPVKGYPMLNWRGKRPFTSTQFFPAQLKEIYGKDVDGWRNKVYWGDNLQVMSHLLKPFRGKVKLIYIDPPFDSKAEYKKSVRLKGASAESDQNSFEEKQYSDIWSNDEYLQFLYERLILLRELLCETGSIFVHCDWHKSHYIRLMLDEIFGQENFRNEIIWVRSTNPKGSQHESRSFSPFTDTIFYYSRSSQARLYLDRIRIPLTEDELNEKYHRSDDKGRFYDGPILRSDGMGARPYLVYEYKGFTPGPAGWRMKKESLAALDRAGDLGWSTGGKPFRKLRPENDKGKPIGSFWNDISLINSQADERIGYPTQKPIKLLERVITATTDPGDLVFDGFIGSGTTLVAAARLGRRFIGADINLAAIQITSKRLLGLADESAKQLDLQAPSDDSDDEDAEGAVGVGIVQKELRECGFELYNVNHYDIFRNPIQAKELLLEALEIQKLEMNSVFDGEKDGRMVKIMPVNRIATRADLNELIAGFDYRTWERRQNESPNRAVEKITLVCMGHEHDLREQLDYAVRPFKVDIEVVDILRDKADLEFKRDSQAKVVIKKGELLIERFYPMNLLQKLSLQKESVEDWRELVESVLIDWNYDGAVLQPGIVDIPGKDALVKGVYQVPADAGTIRVKIIDLLSESWEGSVANG